MKESSKNFIAISLSSFAIVMLFIGMVLPGIPGCGTFTQSTEPDRDELRGWASVQVALAAEGVTVVVPDKPKPGDPCPDCGGDGKVGDGRIEVDCKACDGTGKVPAPRRRSPELERASDEGSGGRRRLFPRLFRRR